MEKTQRMRDEILIQLIKQVRKNNKKSSVEAAFSLLANILSISYPSEGLLFPLMNWLMNMVTHHKNEGYKDWCRYILARVYYMHLAQDKRYFNPDPMEMAYVTNRKRIKIHLFMPNGAFLTLWIESYTTFEELKKEALFRLGYKTKHYWRWGVIEYVEYSDKFGIVPAHFRGKVHREPPQCVGRGGLLGSTQGEEQQHHKDSVLPHHDSEHALSERH